MKNQNSFLRNAKFQIRRYQKEKQGHLSLYLIKKIKIFVQKPSLAFQNLKLLSLTKILKKKSTGNIIPKSNYFRYEDDFQLESFDTKFSDFIYNDQKISASEFKKLFKNAGEEFETSALEFENKTIENVINEMKTSFNLSIVNEEKESKSANNNFKTGKKLYLI